MYPIISIFGLQIPTYFFWISITLSLSLFYLIRRNKQYNLDEKMILDLFLVIGLSALFGARLVHVLYEEFPYYEENWLRIFEVWRGGFVFYGGLLSAILFGSIFIYFKKQKEMAKIFDLCAPVISLAYAFGRFGCLFAGCCYGRTCDLPWSIAGKHPTNIYSSLWEVAVWFIILGSEKKLTKNPGQLFSLWLFLHSVGRFIIEFYRDDFRGPNYIFSISGWISIFLALFGLTIFLTKQDNRKVSK